MNRSNTRYLNTRHRRLGSVTGLAAAAVLAVSAAHAADPGKLALSAYSDGVAGAEVMSGDYGAAITKLAPHGIAFYTDAVSASTNLCVAYVATGQLTQAKAACDEAVRVAQLDLTGVSPLERLERVDSALALAQSNRAVLGKLTDRVVAKLDRR